MKTYDARSTLIHNGTFAEPGLSEAVERGVNTVRQLLQAHVSESIAART